MCFGDDSIMIYAVAFTADHQAAPSGNWPSVIDMRAKFEWPLTYTTIIAWHRSNLRNYGASLIVVSC